MGKTGWGCAFNFHGCHTLFTYKSKWVSMDEKTMQMKKKRQTKYLLSFLSLVFSLRHMQWIIFMITNWSVWPYYLSVILVSNYNNCCVNIIILTIIFIIILLKFGSFLQTVHWVIDIYKRVVPVSLAWYKRDDYNITECNNCSLRKGAALTSPSLCSRLRSTVKR